MDIVIDILGQGFADPAHLLQLLQAGSTDFLLSAKIADQFPAFDRTNTRNLIKKGCCPFLTTTLSVSSYGKTMRLVTDMLEQMQCR